MGGFPKVPSSLKTAVAHAKTRQHELAASGFLRCQLQHQQQAPPIPQDTHEQPSIARRTPFVPDSPYHTSTSIEPSLDGIATRSVSPSGQSQSVDVAPLSENEALCDEIFQDIMHAAEDGEEDYVVRKLLSLGPSRRIFGSEPIEVDYFAKVLEATEAGQTMLDAGLWPGESDSDNGDDDEDEAAEREARTAMEMELGTISRTLCRWYVYVVTLIQP